MESAPESSRMESAPESSAWPSSFMDSAAVPTMSVPLLLASSTRCALETFPLDLVSLDSGTKHLYLFLVDCSRGTQSLVRALLRQLSCLEEFVRRASPDGENQFGCLCFSEWVSFSDTTPFTAPGVAGGADLVLLFEGGWAAHILDALGGALLGRWVVPCRVSLDWGVGDLVVPCSI